MALAYVDIGSGASGNTSVTLQYPAAPDEDTIAVACVDSGHPTGTTIPATPDGWAQVATVVGTSGTYGVDAGPRRLTFFIRQLQGEDDPPTFTIPAGSESRVGGNIVVYSKAATETVVWASGTGEDTTSGTGFSVTTGTVAFAPNDQILMFAVANSSTPTWSGEAIAAAGVTFSAVTERADAQSGFGANASRVTATCSVSTGTATVAATISATLSAAAIGVAGLVRLRAVAASSATLTATYDYDHARVVLTASGLSTLADVARVERTTDGITWTTVRGGVEAALTSGALTIYDYEWTDAVAATYRVTAFVSTSLVETDVKTSAPITPALEGIWLRSPARPFLNGTYDIVQPSTMAVTRPSRTFVHDRVSEALPVPVSDLRTSRRWTLNIRADTDEDHDRLRLLLTPGDVVFIHVPDCGQPHIPAGYVAVGDATYDWHPLRPSSRLWTLPVTEVAPPGPDVAGATVTWTLAIAEYSDWTELLASHPDWASLLSHVGTPTEVIVA